MTETGHKIAVIIPTIGRAAQLRSLLESLAAQTRLPDQVIIVGEDVGGVPSEFPTLRPRFVPMPKSSICEARNAGVAATDRGIDLLAFIDDDIVLEPQAVEATLHFWENGPHDLGGTGLNLVNYPERFAAELKGSPLLSWLGLYNSRPGTVARSGFHTPFGHVDETIEVKWLPSWAVVYRRKVFTEFCFDEWFQSYSYLEDLDLSYRVGKKYRLAVVAGARFCHYPVPSGRHDPYLFGKKEITHRLHFVRKHRELATSVCVVALMGRILLSLALGIRTRDSRCLRQVQGNCAAMFALAAAGLRGWSKGTVSNP